MKPLSVIRNYSLSLVAILLTFAGSQVAAQTTTDSADAAQTSAIPARITQAIDETQSVRLKGNVHPLARAEFDQGAVSDTTPMKRMMLLLQRSPEQQAALQQFMAEQLSKDSPNFHKWLTPEQFGQLYGPGDADIQTVTAWLTSKGYTGIRVSPGRNVIEFSGNVGQVRNTFQTEIHKFVVNGENRQANTSDPQIPAALAPVVAGIVSLHNFPSRSMRHVLGQFTHSRETGETTPQFTGGGGAFFAVGPADFAKIYNIPTTGAGALDGSGTKIAIVGFSAIDVNDAHSFRALFGLPTNDPVIVHNGPDPGFNGEEGEADLDTQVSGMVAPKAEIDFVVSEQTLTSDPVILSSEFVVDNNSDDVMSLSFGTCEALLTANQNAFFNFLWEQAAAQGITVTISAGDNGTAGCDDFHNPAPATGGLAVSGFASTPFDIAVGGTDFDDFSPTPNQSAFWGPASANGPVNRESALGYIHEIPWNNSCAATATPTNLTTCAGANNIVAASGGPSAIYAKPSFQSGITPNGVPVGDNHRYIPDVSLFASNGPQSKSFYVVCQADAVQPGDAPSCAATGSFSFFAVGGTSASAPAFAGIMALINQSEKTRTGAASGRQGNANLVLYKIAATAANVCDSSATPLTGSTTCAFYDVTKGNNSVPCAGNSPNCSSATAGTNGVLVTTNGATKTPAFTAAPGYDLATGLGTVNVTNLAKLWGTTVGTTFKPSATTLTINGSATPASIKHGTPVTAAVTVAAVAPATGTPSGNVAILPANAAVNAGPGSNAGTLSGSPTTITGVLLPGGTLSVTAHYGGDGIFAQSVSAGVPITVTPENSRVQLEIVSFDLAGNLISTNASSVVFGSNYALRMDVLDSTTNPCTLNVTAAGCAFDATGTITLKDNGAPLDGGSFALNSEGHTEDQAINLSGGSHPLTASYSGDVSYNASGPATDTIMVMKATTASSLIANPTTVATGAQITLTANITSQSISAIGPMGNVTFFSGGTQIGSPVAVVSSGAAAPNFASGTAALMTSFTTAGAKTITATYNGDTNYALSNATAINLTVTGGSGSFTVSGGAVTVTAGGMGNSVITVTSTSGFTGMVTVNCPTAANLPPGVTCTAPAALSVPANGSVTGNMTFTVAAPSSTTTASIQPAERMYVAQAATRQAGGKGWWTLSGGTGLAAMLLLFIPGKKRYRAALGLGLVCLLSFTLGCGGGGSGGGGGGGPVATTTQLTVSSTKVAANGMITVSATVTGGTPTGTVQFMVDGTAVGSAAPLTGGSTGNITVTAANAPAFLPIVGTHTVTAQYSGSSTTMASQSGTLKVTVTGTTQVAITGTSGATTANGNVSLTIN